MRAVIYKLLLSLFIILCGTNVSAQDFGSLGLPALTSSLDANGDSTYSLSLQILVLMTVLTVIPSILLGNDSVYPNYNCTFNIAPSVRNAADTTKPGPHCNRSLPNFLYNESFV